MVISAINRNKVINISTPLVGTPTNHTLVKAENIKNKPSSMFCEVFHTPQPFRKYSLLCHTFLERHIHRIDTMGRLLNKFKAR